MASVKASAVQTSTVTTLANVAVGVKSYGAASVRGTSRKNNEDRYDIKVGVEQQGVHSCFKETCLNANFPRLAYRIAVLDNNKQGARMCF